MTALTPEQLIAFRRDLHRHPELSHQESRTAAKVAEALRAAGLAPATGIAGHGVVATLEGDHPGPTLLFRADMDALPITEESRLGYESCNPGVMHACGHDVHTTVGVGVASLLASRRADLHGRIKFVFQPAEEAAPPPGKVIGAELMVREGVLESPAVDAAFALHVMPLLEAGKLGCTGGAVWAGSDIFDIHLTGAMAHGAYPHEGIDPIVAAAAVIQALQSLVARETDAREAAVVSVCRITAGTAYNIIPDRAHLQGTIRTLSTAVRERLLARFVELVKAVATAYGCTAEIALVQGAPVTTNNPTLERLFADRIGGLETVPFKPQMGAEDFSAFARRVPAAFLFLGVRNEERGIIHMIHTPRFDVEESVIPTAVQSMSEALLATARDWQIIAPQLS